MVEVPHVRAVLANSCTFAYQELVFAKDKTLKPGANSKLTL